MEKERKVQSGDLESLKEILIGLKDLKFTLDCGHQVTFGYFLGNDIIVRNGKVPEITCLECGL